MARPVDVYVTEGDKVGPRDWFYVVLVDGKPYDQFTSRGKHLTRAEGVDVANGYREALSSHVVTRDGSSGW